ncbi:MAG: hypothetical protein WCR24_07065 [Candidatus Methanomethylophilaceae archaeon]
MATIERSSMITPIPDTNTAESIMYGSKYRFAKSSKFYWDSVEDYLIKLQKEMTLDIIDPAFCEYVVKRNPMMIYASEPPVDSVDRIKDLHTLRILLNVKKALHDVEIRRTENLQYAQIHGISEYSAKMREGGIDDDVWKAATLRYDEPIEFDTIRAKRDMDEKVAKYDAEILQRRIQQYRKMRDMVTQMTEEETKEDVPEEEPEIELNIVKEVEEVDVDILKVIEIDEDPESSDESEESEGYEDEGTASESVEPNDYSEPNDGVKDDPDVIESDSGQPIGGIPEEEGGIEDEDEEYDDVQTEDDCHDEQSEILGDGSDPVEEVNEEETTEYDPEEER